MPDDFDVREGVLQEKLAGLQRKKRMITRDIETTEHALRDLSLQREHYRVEVLLRTPLPDKFRKLRDELLQLVSESKREDITVARGRELYIKLIPAATERLRAVCAHPFVAGEPGYNDEFSYDHDRDQNAMRRCVACGFKEYGDTRNQGFKILVSEEGRVLEEVYDGDPRMKDQLLSMDENLKYFRMSRYDLFSLIHGMEKVK